MLYVDHAATTPMRPEVVEAMAPFLRERHGNPSGVHSISRRAKDALEEARERVAAVLGCQPLEVVFTGGGTEADNLAVKGAALAGRRRGGVVTVATEHEAVLESAAFLEITEIDPDTADRLVFNGWMFASSPAVNPLEHGVYDVWVMECEEPL